MNDGEKTEPAAPAVVTEPAVVIPQQRGPEMYTPPMPDPGAPPTAGLPVSAPPVSAAPASGSPAPAPPTFGSLVSAPPVSGPPLTGPPPAAPPIVPPMYWQTPTTGPAPLAPHSPSRRRWPVVSGVAVAALLVLVFVVWIASQGPGGQTVSLPAHAIPGRSAAQAGAAPGKTEPTVSDKIMETLKKQAKALLAGDHDGYLAGVGAGLQDGYNRRFNSLRAMGVQAWNPTLVDKPTQGTDGAWKVLVRYDYCFGQGCTQQFPQVVQTSWTVAGDQATVSAYEQSSEPWDASALQVATGRRVIVAGSGANASKLKNVVSKADAAADVADRYAHWDAPPKWYIVYVAGPGEWKSWWDNGDIGASYDGYSTGPRGIVIQAADATEDFLQILLTHEFGHVVTVGEDYGTAEDWWLMEGIADYISDRNGETMRGRVPSVRQFVKHGWDGTITLGPPPEKAGGEEISARYGIALIAITCLARKYGEPKMLDFFGAVVRKNEPLESASTSVLGADWAGVAATCAAQVRNA